MRRLLVILGVVMMSFSLFGCFGSKKKITEIQRFEFTRNVSTVMDGNIVYTVKKTDDGYTANIKPVGVSPDESPDFAIEDSKVEELIGILNTYEVASWDGFDKVDRGVLDGNSFFLYIQINDKDSIAAHGYMKYPKDYKAVREALEAFFEGLDK